MKVLLRWWYKRTLHPLLYGLVPCSYLFGLITALRRLCYRYGICKSYRLSIPVIVVGNINLGGNGKTPLVAYLANALVKRGYRPGIASRGYGGKQYVEPHMVSADSSVHDVGDEALLLKTQTSCPIVISIDRYAAAHYLQKLGSNIIICDDGLQHYRLQRDLEIAVVDGLRYCGNHYLLPAGPLREPIARLSEVDMVVINNIMANIPMPACLASMFYYTMFPRISHFSLVNNPNIRLRPNAFAGKVAHVVAAIGNPEGFFHTMRQLSITIIPHSLPDHYFMHSKDLCFNDDLPIIITTKDAVKCAQFNLPNLWCAHMEIVLDHEFLLQVLTKLGLNN